MGYIELDGVEEWLSILEKATIDEADAKKAMRKTVNELANAIEKDTPKGTTGKLAKIKKTVKSDGLAVVGEIKLGAFYGMFQEFGTSKSKKNIGFFDRSVRSTQDKAIKILSKELLDKAFVS